MTSLSRELNLFAYKELSDFSYTLFNMFRFIDDGKIMSTKSLYHFRDLPPVSLLRRSRAHFKETFRLGEATRSDVSERESCPDL